MRITALCLLLIAALPSCKQRMTEPSGQGGQGAAPREGVALQLPVGLPAGSSCTGRSDCAGDHVCVGGTCRYRKTSVRGEALAVAAKEQAEGGDRAGALRTYTRALEAYEQLEAPVPPSVLCGAARIALETARDEQSREAAAARADTCFRGSLPGNPEREAVLAALGQRRHEGLALAGFDQSQPPDRFFTEESSRPSVDAVAVTMSLPSRPDLPGYDTLETRLRADAAQRGIAECFLRDYEQRHEREARAALVLGFTTRLQQSGDFDVYAGQVAIGGATDDESFAGCVAEHLREEALPGPRLARMAAWQEPFEVLATLE